MKQNKQKRQLQKPVKLENKKNAQGSTSHKPKIDPTLPFPFQTELTVTSQLGVPGMPQTYSINYVDHNVAGRIKISTSIPISFLHIFLSNTWLPFSITLTTHDHKTIGVIKKPWNPWSNAIYIYDDNKQLLGRLLQKSTFTQQKFELYNTEDKRIAEFVGIQRGAIFQINPIDTPHSGSITIIKSNIIAVALTAQRRSKILLPPVKDAHKRCIIIAAMTLPVITKELLS
jgi:hypothetical protein